MLNEGSDRDPDAPKQPSPDGGGQWLWVGTLLALIGLFGWMALR